MRTLFTSVWASLLLSCVFGSSESFAITFDKFLQPQLVTDLAGGSGSASVVTDSTILGGARTLRTQATSGGGFITCSIDQGAVEHSQSASQGGALGLTILTWDGDLDSTTTNFIGLGGINLTEDQATALRVGISFFDVPGQQATIRIRLYDASDSFGDTYSEYSFALSSLASQPIVKELPFASPSAVGIAGPANVSNIGAITMTIDGRNAGAGAADIVLNYFGTNGNCDRVPYNGSALDRCGVCGGDSTSCLQCQTVDIKELLQAIDNGAKVQEDVVKRALYVLKRAKKDPDTQRFSRQTGRKAHQLQLTNWQRTWFIKTTVIVCSNTVQCTSVDTGSATVMEAYRADALKLKNLVSDVVQRIGKTNKTTKKLLADAESTYQKYYNMTFEVPTSSSECHGTTPAS